MPTNNNNNNVSSKPKNQKHTDNDVALCRPKTKNQYVQGFNKTWGCVLDTLGG